MAVRITALYRFATLDRLEERRATLAALCEATGIRGTILLAEEGINGTIAGSPAGVEQVLDAVRGWPDFADLTLRDMTGEVSPFHRMKVRIKREIVTMGEPAIAPRDGTGHYVAPEDWNALIAQSGTILIDTRNDYEVAIGTFRGAIDPATRSFRDFSGWFRAHRAALTAGDAPPRIAMFCTGGIRCEKATAFLRAEGIDEVYHLQGGILGYLETVPVEESAWEGECFVFDERVAVGHGLAAGSHVLCRGCRMPVSAADRRSPHYVEGVACPACHESRDARQQSGYAERHRQVVLAEARGGSHVGVSPGAVGDGDLGE